MSLPALDFRRASPTTDAVATRRPLASFAPLLAAALAIAAGLVAVNNLPVGGFFDDAFYVILAKSLATGHGYRNLNLPGAPLATHYPPGYPLFLAALWRLWPTFPDNVVLFKGANAVLLGASTAGAIALARARFRLTTPVATAVVVLGTLSIPLLSFGTVLFSEP